MPISQKQRLFIEEYLISANATQAAIKAGYSKSTARSQGSRLLTDADILAEIEKGQAEGAENAGITRDRVLKEYAKVAFLDIRSFYTVDGALKPVKELGDEAAGALAGIEIYEEKITDIDAEEQITTGTTKKIKVFDKVKALDSICKVLGYNAAEVVKNIGKQEILVKFTRSRD